MGLNQKADAAMRRELAKCFPERAANDPGHARLAAALSDTARHTPGPWIEKLSGPDRHGRFSYFIHWLATYHPGHPLGEHRLGLRGQVYFADPVANGHDKYTKWDGGITARAAIAKAEGGAK